MLSRADQLLIRATRHVGETPTYQWWSNIADYKRLCRDGWFKARSSGRSMGGPTFYSVTPKATSYLDELVVKDAKLLAGALF